MNHKDHVALIRGAVYITPDDLIQPAVWADLGSGTGAFTLALAELLPAGSHIYSVDKDSDALERQRRIIGARFAGAEMSYLQADFTRHLPIPSLDGLNMANALHFVPAEQRAGVVSMICGLLKPGGRFCLVEYNTDYGNQWVPYPMSYTTWRQTAASIGLQDTRLVATTPSSFLGEFYCALSTLVPSNDI